jgi:hypothetical protein
LKGSQKEDNSSMKDKIEKNVNKSPCESPSNKGITHWLLRRTFFRLYKGRVKDNPLINKLRKIVSKFRRKWPGRKQVAYLFLRKTFFRLYRRRVKDKPLINILTRTSKRPLGFRRCAESVQLQTYPNVRHIVSVDDDQDLEYVYPYTKDVVVLDRKLIEAEPDIDNPGIGRRFIFNKYLNHLIASADDGWIIILDDDDYLVDQDVLAKIAAAMQYETDMILWQMQYPDERCLPDTEDLYQRPQEGRIGSPCFTIHRRIAAAIEFDGWKNGDFRYMDKIWQLTIDARWIPEPLIKIGTNDGGWGKRKDMQIPISQ